MIDRKSHGHEFPPPSHALTISLLYFDSVARKGRSALSVSVCLHHSFSVLTSLFLTCFLSLTGFKPLVFLRLSLSFYSPDPVTGLAEQEAGSHGSGENRVHSSSALHLPGGSASSCAEWTCNRKQGENQQNQLNQWTSVLIFHLLLSRKRFS